VSAGVAQADSLLSQLAGHSNWELTCGPVDGDLSTSAWQVHSVNGGYNDREWSLIGAGDTPALALTDALNNAQVSA
jgi:hypothetical protein